MPTDPLTGVPADWVPLTQYQVPLGTNPVLAPEWKPQGKVGNVLYPDNIPTVFATVQGQNRLAPDVAQAVLTDGQGRMLVSLGGEPVQATPTGSFNTNGFATTGTGFTIGGSTFPKPHYIWAILFFVAFNDPLPTGDTAIGFTWAIQSNPSGTRFGIATGMLKFANASTSGGNLAYNENIWLPNPIDMSTAFPLSDTDANVGIATIAGLTCACSIVYQAST